ncbi:MAG: NADH-quinone oxidoreductase subunit NuoH [Thermoproteota archaeon]
MLEGLAQTLGVPVWALRAVLAPLVYPGLLAFTVLVLFIIWAERKIAARVQMRIGPYYVSRQIHGALQMLADGLRVAFQEVIVPVEAEKTAFVLAPILSFTALSAAFTVVPGGPGIYGFDSSFSMLIAYATLSLAPIMIILMGWSSSNKFSYIGAGRETLVTITGEVTLLAALLSAAAMYGTLSFNEAVELQRSANVIGLLANPLAALLFFIASIALTDRVPFDLVLGEQEIVQGPYTEYTGVLFALTMALDYGKLYVLMLMFTHLFLGGWAPFDTPLLGSVAVFVKTTVLMLIAVFLRAVYGRMRLDQVASLFWSWLFPLALLSLVISVLVHPVFS